MSTSSTPPAAWSGRFSEPVSEIVKRYTASIPFDYRLAEFDIQGSLAHAAMLHHVGILTKDDLGAIRSGMAELLAEIRAGQFVWSLDREDVHLNIEAALTAKIGDAGKRLHTGRSRNDQVATDIRLWVRDACDRTVAQLKDLQRTLLDRAEQHAGDLMPGFTHLQTAQPVTFGHHLMAYVEMFGRDASRFADARARMNENPLGAAALAGSPFPIDRHMTAQALGFDRPMANSLDAVSDRDFALESLAAASIAAGHLSRLAEEIVVWMTPLFGLIRLSDRFTTGSSIMPQKRNPDAAELVRAKTGRIIGALIALTTVMKGLPLAYSKDMQEDKPPVFEAFDALDLALTAMTAMVAAIRPNTEKMAAAAGAGFSTATDLADWLVRELGLPFRQAHHVTGAAVKRAEALGLGLGDLPLSELQALDARITEGVYEVLTPEASCASRQSFGGTAPEQVRARIADGRNRL